MLTKDQSSKLKDLIKEYAEAQNNAHTLGRDHLEKWYAKAKELNSYIDSLLEKS